MKQCNRRWPVPDPTVEFRSAQPERTVQGWSLEDDGIPRWLLLPNLKAVAVRGRRHLDHCFKVLNPSANERMILV